MAVDREDGFVGVRNALNEFADNLSKLMRYGVTYCIRNVDGTGASIDHFFDDTAHKVQFRAARIFERELDIIDQIARPLNRVNSLFNDTIRFHLKLVLHMNWRGCNKRMNSTLSSISQRFTSTINVSIQSTRK